jgi:hypothetical protein
MAREFKGVLTDDPKSLKQFFVTQDALLPLEWRLNFMVGNTNNYQPMLNYFDRIVAQDHYLENLFPFYLDHAKNMFLNLEIKPTDDPIARIKVNTSLPFRGLDMLAIPIHFIEQNPMLLDEVSKIQMPIRRLDILFPIYGYVPAVNLKPWETFTKSKNIMLNTISQYDPLEVDAWYSKPNYEGRVDPVPEPYVEDGFRYAPMGDSMFFRDGFYLNGQLSCEETVSGEPFVVDFNPRELILNIIIEKIKRYKQYSRDIKNKKDNIYWTYFNYVAKNIKVNKDFNYVPEFLLPRYTKFYEQMVSDKCCQNTPLGLYWNNGKKLKSIIEVKS